MVLTGAQKEQVRKDLAKMHELIISSQLNDDRVMFWTEFSRTITTLAIACDVFIVEAGEHGS